VIDDGDAAMTPDVERTSAASPAASERRLAPDGLHILLNLLAGPNCHHGQWYLPRR
jgi:hypothetical protein